MNSKRTAPAESLIRVPVTRKPASTARKITPINIRDTKDNVINLSKFMFEYKISEKLEFRSPAEILIKIVKNVIIGGIAVARIIKARDQNIRKLSAPISYHRTTGHLPIVQKVGCIR